MDFAKSLKYCKKHLQLMPNAYQKSIHSYSTIVQFVVNLYSLLNKLQDTETKINFPISALNTTWPHDWIQCTSTSSIYAHLTIIYNLELPIPTELLHKYLHEIDFHFGKFNNYDQQYDLRFFYCCLSSLKLISLIQPLLLNETNAVIEKHRFMASSYIHSCQSYHGGYANSVNGIVMEPHAGYTYCAIAALCLLKEAPTNKWKLIKWLVLRQQKDGGLQGRINKPSDTCYSFWITASLEMIKGKHYLNLGKLNDFMVGSASALGGFGKTAAEYPDPLHSYLGTAGYLLSTGNTIIDPVLNVFKK